MRYRLGLLCCCLTAQAGGLAAQAPPVDTLSASRYFVAPKYVFKFATQVKIDGAEQERIRAADREATEASLPLERRLRAAKVALDGLLKAPRLDEAAVLAAAREVFEVETELRMVRLRVLVRTRNELSPEQRARVQRLIAAEAAR